MRSFVAVQIPILDTRGLTARTVHPRLARPVWPDPKPGVEFIRSLGGIRKRARGGIGAWDDERAYCEANRLLRFKTDPGNARESLSVAYRRLYGFEYGYRLDVGFVASSVPSIGWAALATRALQVPVAVPGSTKNLMIQAAGPAIAHFLQSATQPWTGSTASGPYLLVAGEPAVLIETVDPSLPGATLTARIEGPLAPCLRIDTPDRRLRDVRSLRGTLWRLHTELTLLRELGRFINSEGASLLTSPALDLLAQLTQDLARERRNGWAQPTLVAMSSSFGPLALGELLDLAAAVEGQSAGLAKRLRMTVDRARRDKFLTDALSSGINIDKFIVERGARVGHEIKATGGSIVNVDSIINNSFNAVKSEDSELADALVELLAHVKEQGDPKATKLAEAMVQFAGEDNKTLFEASWDGLKKVMPTVASLATVTGVIARFLGVG